MTKRRCGTSLLVLAMWTLAVITPGIALAQDTREATRLQAAAPADVPLGNLASIMAKLEDAQGKAMPNATIVFSSPATFGGVVSEMELGEILTDMDGIAVLDYQLRIEGENQFIARYHGDDAHQPAEASVITQATGTAQLSERSAGVKVPFLGSWTLVLVLMGVWSVYLVVMILIIQIPETTRQQG